MEERRVRISDIAEELGLSTATVSNVLHGKTNKVSDETVKRVQALLEERRYIPSMAGILLAQNSSRIIGVVINDHEKYEAHTLEDLYIASSLNQLSLEIEKSGQYMMVKKTTDPEEIIRFASMWNLDGMVLMGFCQQDYARLRSHMRIPFVVYDGYCGQLERICNITVDNFDGGFQVGAHFRALGHRRALCVSDNEICVDKERCDGFRAGFGGGKAELMLVPMRRRERRELYLESLERLRGCSAVFAVSDCYAIELVQFLQEHGVAVPGDVSVAGFDDTPMCALVSPPLTSVRQDVSLRARLAIEKLRELRDGGAAAVITLPVTLVRRGSTGAARE